MEDPMLENMTRLLRIAEEDASYQAWYQSWQKFAPEFAAFANSQPEEIRNILYGKDIHSISINQFPLVLRRWLRQFQNSSKFHRFFFISLQSCSVCLNRIFQIHCKTLRIYSLLYF